MTTDPQPAPEPTYEPVVCGARETRVSGNWECVNPAPCSGGHYYRLLNTGKRGGA